MAWLEKTVPYDRNGVVGPALSLICFSQNLKIHCLFFVVKLLQENSERLVKRSIHGRKNFIHAIEKANQNKESLSVKQILNSKLFQELQSSTPDPSSHHK